VNEQPLPFQAPVTKIVTEQVAFWMKP
jgi:hypothetical protein